MLSFKLDSDLALPALQEPEQLHPSYYSYKKKGIRLDNVICNRMTQSILMMYTVI